MVVFDIGQKGMLKGATVMVYVLFQHSSDMQSDQQITGTGLFNGFGFQKLGKVYSYQKEMVHVFIQYPVKMPMYFSLC